MATITLKIRVRRIEGRNKVEDSVIGAAIAEQVEDLGEFEVDDTEGETATYEITNVALLVEQLELEDADAPPAWFCAWDGKPISYRVDGRRRLYCSDACRQAAYRDRNNLA
jgi:hypothetical protein